VSPTVPWYRTRSAFIRRLEQSMSSEQRAASSKQGTKSAFIRLGDNISWIANDGAPTETVVSGL
jgi:hypothetical protein